MKTLCSLFVLLLVTLSLVSAPSAKEVHFISKNVAVIVDTQVGETVDAANHSIMVDAVKSCVGRIYFSRELIMARTLLDRYLDQYVEKFINATKELKRTYSEGNPLITLQVYVNTEKLIDDLREKRFVYQPRYNPYIAVFLKEKVDDEISSFRYGQENVLNTLVDRMIKVRREPFPGFEPYLNLTGKDANYLPRAIIECEKAGCELIVTGAVDSTLIEKKDIYYSQYTFYETEVALSLIRVDTGEVLYETRASEIASHTSPERALELSIQRAAVASTNKMADFYKELWQKMILGKTDYQLMISGISKEEVELLTEYMRSLGEDTEFYLRNFYHDVAVLNLDYPGHTDTLLDFLISAPHPRLRVVDVRDSKIELKVE